MKKLAALLCLSVVAAIGAADEMHHPAPAGSKEFERLKTLVGAWSGTKEGHETGNVSVEYSLTSGGSAVVEKLFPGTPEEMISVFYDQGGQPEMTHYCMLGNRPSMALMRADDKVLAFGYVKSRGINPHRDAHMHSLVIYFSDSEHIVETWTSFEKGKEKDSVVFRLARTNK